MKREILYTRLYVRKHIAGIRMNFSDPNALIEPDELAERWKMKPMTLAHWRWTGRGPRFLKMGRNTFYRLKDIQAFEEKKVRSSTTNSYGIEDILEHPNQWRKKMNLKRCL